MACRQFVCLLNPRLYLSLVSLGSVFFLRQESMLSCSTFNMGTMKVVSCFRWQGMVC